MHPSEALRTVGQWTPSDLGVHQTIERLTSSADVWEPLTAVELTPYFVRSHDRRLRNRLKMATDGESVFTVLVGDSATGKTRALYEAINDKLQDWPLLVPSDSDLLREWIETDAIDARTVLWLDEAQRFLPDMAKHLTNLLNRVRPLAVVAAMWRQNWDELTVVPEGSRGPEADVAFHMRRLIKQQRPEIAVADRFNEEQIRELRRLGLHDSRLAAAMTAAEADGRVLQHLTGGPQLVDRYENGAFTPIEHAVLTAALDLRRLGHSTPIAPTVLEAATPGYLPPGYRVTERLDWIDDVLTALARNPRRRADGAISPLNEDRTALGIGPADGYYPADYLDQRTRRTRRRAMPPESLWEAALGGRTERDLVRLGASAERLHLESHAIALYEHAAESGDTLALRHLASLRENRGDWEPAEDLLRQAVIAGDTHAMGMLAGMREERDDKPEAERLAQLAADAGDTWALLVVGSLRAFGDKIPRDWEGAKRMYRVAADAGDTEAMRALAEMFDKELNSDDESERWYQRAADAGDTKAMLVLGWLRMQAGDRDGAKAWYQMALDAGDTGGAFKLVDLHTPAREFDDAERAACQPAEAGDTDALRYFARTRDKAGDHDEARRIYLLAAEVGDSEAMNAIGDSWIRAGDQKRARHWLERAARAGNGAAMNTLAFLAREAGDTATADQWQRRADEHWEEVKYQIAVTFHVGHGIEPPF